MLNAALTQIGESTKVNYCCNKPARVANNTGGWFIIDADHVISNLGTELLWQVYGNGADASVCLRATKPIYKRQLWEGEGKTENCPLSATLFNTHNK